MMLLPDLQEPSPPDGKHSDSDNRGVNCVRRNCGAHLVRRMQCGECSTSGGDTGSHAQHSERKQSVTGEVDARARGEVGAVSNQHEAGCEPQIELADRLV
jgi:hypothetical protein